MRQRPHDRGQDLVEYAIVFPVLMLLVLGIFEFGRILYSYNAIANAAREGARFAVVPSSKNYLANVTEKCDGPSNLVVRRVCDRALALPGRLTVTVSRPTSDTVRVHVAYDGTFLTNLLLNTIGRPSFILQAAATMRLE